MAGAGFFRRAGRRARTVLRRPLTWGLLLHAGSRWLFHAEGIRFDSTSLGWFWQFVDPALLREDYLRSIFYLHAQPPLFNAYLGGVLQVAPRHAYEVFWGCALAFGLVLHLSL